MKDVILREESDRFHVYLLAKDGVRHLGCHTSEEEARDIWAEGQKVINKVNASPLAVDLYQSRTCSDEPPFILKKGIT